MGGAMKDERLALKTQARLIPADLAKPERVVEVGLLDPPSIDELRAVISPLIGGGDIEHMRVFTHFLAEGFSRYLDLFIDENGRAKGLAPNPRATRIYQNNVLTHQQPPPNPAALPLIYGDAVLFRDEVWS